MQPRTHTHTHMPHIFSCACVGQHVANISVDVARAAAVKPCLFEYMSHKTRAAAAAAAAASLGIPVIMPVTVTLYITCKNYALSLRITQLCALTLCAVRAGRDSL